VKEKSYCTGFVNPQKKAVLAGAYLVSCQCLLADVPDDFASNDNGSEPSSRGRTCIIPAMPPIDLAKLWEEHTAHEFTTRDTEATLATMTDDAYVNHVPVLTGGYGKEALRRFYSQDFIPSMPPDTTLTPVSRTIGEDQLVDEMIFSFTQRRKFPGCFQASRLPTAASKFRSLPSSASGMASWLTSTSTGTRLPSSNRLAS
jgi:hypothetical protein